MAPRERAVRLSDPVKPGTDTQPDALPHPPLPVRISWDLARNIETLLRTAGFPTVADLLREQIDVAEFVAREGGKTE